MNRLRRVLRGIGWLYPDLGYCQGVGVIGAILLLLLEEEDAFWLLSAIVEDLLPASYYTPSLIGKYLLSKSISKQIHRRFVGFKNLLKKESRWIWYFNDTKSIFHLHLQSLFKL